MRVVCDNCGASYKIPESKLTKEVNKATCRKCGHAILIRRVAAAPRVSAPEPGLSGPDERTQITSAAALERQGRARTGGPEAAPADNRGMLDPNVGEETVPRDDAEPPVRPAGASTDPGGAGAVARPASVSASPRSAGPVPQPAMPRAGARPAAPVAEPAVNTPRTPPPPVRAVPAAPIGRPPTIPPPVSAVPEAKPSTSADIVFTVGGVLLGVLGAVMLLAGTALSISPLGYLGIFLLLFGLLFVVIMLVTGGLGQRPASKLGATAGGLFIGALGALAWMLVQLQISTPNEAIAKTEPPAEVTTTVVKTEEPTPPPAEVAPPVEPPPAAGTPAEVTPPPAPETPPVAMTPEEKAKAEAKAKADAEAKAEAKAKAEADAKAKAEAKAKADAERAAAGTDVPERITSTKTETKPTSTTTTTPASTSTKTTTSSSTSSGAGLSVQAVATMVNSNKGVKLCYLKEANLAGAVPRAKVKITIQPSGKPTRAVAVGEYAGTDFGNCIGNAIMGITFPPFDGEPSTITYAN